MLMFSYILKGIEKGRAGILPAIFRGRDARPPLCFPRDAQVLIWRLKAE